MKKLLSVMLSMIMAMSFFTGCVSSKPDENPDPTPTPTPTPEVDVDPIDTEDPNYATVLAMWEDMDGYWVDEEGDYLLFKLDDSGKAEIFVYDENGNLEKQMKTSAVMASNKTSYYMAFGGSDTGYFIELEGYGDGYVKIAEEADEYDYEVFAYVGENLDNLKEAIKTAEKIEKE